MNEHYRPAYQACDPPLPKQTPPGSRISWFLTIGVHLLLALFLFVGISWKSRPPASVVEVELYGTAPVPLPETTNPPPPLPEPVPKPVPEPIPEPAPKAKPETRIESKPTSKASEPLPPEKPDIRTQSPEKKPQPEPKPEPAPEPESGPDPEPVPEEDLFSDLMVQEASQASQRKKQIAQEKRAAEKRARQAQKAQEEWADQVNALVRSYIVIPPNVSGKPRAIFRVRLFPDGGVRATSLQVTSGNKTLDIAIERAIRKASPLPLPRNRAAFKPVLDITFRPLG